MGAKFSNLEKPTLKEITSQSDSYLVILSSKTYVFEDKLTKYQSNWLIICFSVAVY